VELVEREKVIKELPKLKENAAIRVEVEYLMDVVKYFMPKLSELERDSEVIL